MFKDFVEEGSAHDIKKRSVISTLSLFFQSGYSAVLGLVANLILTILLSPAVFGIYITVLSLISLMNYFSDVGLAGALIQKKEVIEDDVTTTFTVQQTLTLLLIILGFFATSFIKTFYNLPQAGIYLYWALLISFYISSLKTIPSVFLERKIQFQKIVFVQIIENTVFYTSVSVFALLGYGLHSFTISVLLRAVVGLILIYAISFWMPRFGISKHSLKQLLTFGVPFQASSFLGLFKDDLIILYLGKVLGFEGLGYIGWAKKWADAPIRIIMDNISKVIFPLIARFQDDKHRIESLIEKILHYQTAILAPAILGMMLLINNVVEFLPNYQKWRPALPLFYLFAASSLLISFFAPFMNLFNALGKVKLTFSYMLLFTALMWILTPILTKYFGYWGFPLAHIIVSVSYIRVFVKAKEFFDFHLYASTYKFIVSAIAMAIVVYLVETNLSAPPNIFIPVIVFAGISTYLIFLIALRVNIFNEINSFLQKKPEV